jgi:hypothetical protein
MVIPDGTIVRLIGSREKYPDELRAIGRLGRVLRYREPETYPGATEPYYEVRGVLFNTTELTSDGGWNFFPDEIRVSGTEEEFLAQLMLDELGR